MKGNMKNRFLIIVVLISLYFAGCSPANAVLTPEYKNKKISRQNLTIIRLFEEPSIDNTSDVIDDLGEGEPTEVYLSYFDKTFTTSFRNSSCFDKIYLVKNISQTNLEKRELAVNSREKMKMLLPKDSIRIENDSIKTDYLLFVDKLKIHRTAGSSGSWIGTMHTGGSFPTLYHQINFVFWDNKQGKIISYGHVEDESIVIFAMTKSNWEFVIQGLTKKILAYSPFVNPYLDY